MITAEEKNTTINDEPQTKSVDESWAVKLMNECKQEMEIATAAIKATQDFKQQTKKVKKNFGYSDTALSAIEIQIRNWQKK